MTHSSQLIENAVDAFASLPGIGRKTALRLVLNLLKQEKDDVIKFSEAIAKMRSEIRFCQSCNNVADSDICSICASPRRDPGVVCVVEELRDLMAIENTGQSNGVYHVLGGVISPIDGIGPDQLNMASPIEKATAGEVQEVIMALSPTIEGDTTIFYLSKHIKDLDIKITTIARGVSFGGELEYTDELTLARSLTNRLPYDNYFSNSQE